MSVEDPVEYYIPNANQQQVNEKAGITFDALLKSAVRQDPAAFADTELRFRRTFRYPPSTHLLLALWTDPDAEAAFRSAVEGSAALAASPVAPTVKLLGPAPAPLERLKGLSRVQLLVRSESREALAPAGTLLAALEVPPRLDVDPQSLL